MSFPKTDLTRQGICYTGGYRQAQVSAHMPDIWDKPGTYLQIVEGCGYTVYELSPDEAEIIGNQLIRAAKASRAAFPNERNL